MKKRFIVKVQWPLLTTEINPLVMVYNKNRKIDLMVPACKGLKKEMKGQFKVFFYAFVKDKQVVLNGVAPWQSW